MTPDEEAYIKQLEQAYEKQIFANPNSQYQYSASAIGGGSKQNLVEWQLDFRDEMLEIIRYLRNDIQVIEPDGNEHWIINTDPEKVLLNEQGVIDVMRQIRMVLNKNTVLSYYREDEIRERIRQLGHELRALIYNNAEMYGIHNEYQVNNYSPLVLTIICMIDSAYRRAINGEERKGLNEARIVNQNEPIGVPNNTFNMYPQQNKKGFMAKLAPWNWGK